MCLYIPRPFRTPPPQPPSKVPPPSHVQKRAHTHKHIQPSDSRRYSLFLSIPFFSISPHSIYSLFPVMPSPSYNRFLLSKFGMRCKIKQDIPYKASTTRVTTDEPYMEGIGTKNTAAKDKQGGLIGRNVESIILFLLFHYFHSFFQFLPVE